MAIRNAKHDRRRKLEQEIVRLSRLAIFGSLSETHRVCGKPRCRCHAEGPKHGPYLTVSYRSAEGKTAGFSVPKGAEQAIRDGVESWRRLQQCLRDLADENKEHVLDDARAVREEST